MTTPITESQRAATLKFHERLAQLKEQRGGKAGAAYARQIRERAIPALRKAPATA